MIDNNRNNYLSRFNLNFKRNRLCNDKKKTKIDCISQAQFDRFLSNLERKRNEKSHHYDAFGM